MTNLLQLSRDLAALAALHAGSVVSLRGRTGAASGFVWRDGLLVTADEPFDTDEGLHANFADGRAVPARLVGFDPSTDVALLRVDAPTPPPVPLDAAAPLAVGELALALGRTGDGPLAAMGVVAAAGPGWRSMRGGRIDALLRLDLRLDPLGEGGLAVDAAGRAFGMTVLGPRRRALAIPAATVERVAAQLLARGRVARGYLGLGLQPVRVDGREERGFLVASVDPDGPGRAAGLAQGDVLVGWDGEPLPKLRALLARLDPDSVGREVRLAALRGGEPREVRLVIGERPAE